jgi:hypothetical protein
MVMLKAFFDETATHDDSRVIGIGGFVGCQRRSKNASAAGVKVHHER